MSAVEKQKSSASPAKRDAKAWLVGAKMRSRWYIVFFLSAGMR
jgi:hypothetical protein